MTVTTVNDSCSWSVQDVYCICHGRLHNKLQAKVYAKVKQLHCFALHLNCKRGWEVPFINIRHCLICRTFCRFSKSSGIIFRKHVLDRIEYNLLAKIIIIASGLSAIEYGEVKRWNSKKYLYNSCPGRLIICDVQEWLFIDLASHRNDNAITRTLIRAKELLRLT